MTKNHIKEYNKAMEIIEEKIKNSEEVTNEGLAKELGYEQHYFSKIFQKYAEMTIQEYVKKRKMSRAFVDLIRTTENGKKKSISEVAEKYLYSTDGFTKAFKEYFGVLPSKVRNNKTLAEDDDRIWDLFVSGMYIEDYSNFIEEPKSFQIIDGEEMKFIGIYDICDNDEFRSFELINTINDNGRYYNLDYYSEGKYVEQESYYAIYYTPFTDYTKESNMVTIPKRKWLVIFTEGIERGLGISSLSTYVRYEWIKKHKKYVIDDGYEIGFQNDVEIGNSWVGVELWVPIKEK